jgi:thioredoxin reductase (NADPH)
VQAQKFGAEVMIPSQAVALECVNPGNASELVITLRDGRTLRARTVVVASGAQYRRPDVRHLGEFDGRGVWYWASALEAKMCGGSEVILVGGGNSAGQAAVFLAQHAAKVHMLVRGSGLAASMSRYLIDRIEATPNIELHAHSELTQFHGDPAQGLAAVSWRNNRTGAEGMHPIHNVFLFVGADPETRWLAGCGMKFDDNGFILTGDATLPADGTKPDSLESSIPGVFAVGDVRSGSVKRVGGAIGEGAAVVAQIHRYLARRHESGAPDVVPPGPRRMTTA